MPRGRKATVAEPVLSSGHSEDEEVDQAPVMSSSEKNASVGETTTRKGRRKAVPKVEDCNDLSDAAVSSTIPKSRSRAATKKKETETTSSPAEDVEGSFEGAKKGRGRGKKAAAIEKAQVEKVVDTSDAPKKGRAKKDAVSHANEPASVPTGKVTVETVKEAARDDAENVAAEENKKGRGRGKKVTEAEGPAANGEAVVEEKKKRGGRSKNTAKDEECNAQAAALTNEQQEVDVEESEAATDLPSSKKSRSKKTPQKSKQEEHADDVINDEEDTAEEVPAPTDESKKKRGRGRKATTIAVPEVDQEDDLPILHVSQANIETRKGRGTPRATTPAPPMTPTQEDAVVDEKKGRGRHRKETASTPQSAATDNAEEPKKKGGRPKKAVEKQEEVDQEVGSPSVVPKERKRKDGGAQSQIAKKSQKQK